jgi:hypothetical protein
MERHLKSIFSKQLRQEFRVSKDLPSPIRNALEALANTSPPGKEEMEQSMRPRELPQTRESTGSDVDSRSATPAPKEE